MKVKLTKNQPSCWRNWLENGSLRLASSMLLPLLMVLLSFDLGLAQPGGCACNNSINLSLNNVPNGTTTITRDMVLEDPGSCQDDFIRISHNGQALNMASGPSHHPLGLNGVYFYFNLNCNQVTPMGVMLMCGQTLTAEVLDWDGNVLCWGYVYVEDKWGPTCGIQDVTMPCDVATDPSSVNLWAFPTLPPTAPTGIGWPTRTDNCGLAPGNPDHEIIHDARNSCGVGYFVRRWTTTDRCGNTTTCEQTITTVDWEAPEIAWPCDILLDCEEAAANGLDPDALAAYNGFDPYNPDCVYDYPFASDNCSSFAYNYTDQDFVQCDGACYKILRHWSVLDWCNYNPVTGAGVWGTYSGSQSN